MSEKSSKIPRYILCFIIFCVGLRICGSIAQKNHVHEWQEADCTKAKTCATCGETEGEPLGHVWQEATCTAPRICEQCHEREGAPYGHQWVDATCEEPEKCSVCGEKRHWYSLPLGHDWVDATCTTPKTCTRCGRTEGDPEHYFVSYGWETTVEPTCHSEGEATRLCLLCGAVDIKILPPVDHKEGDWEVVTEATPSADGTKAKYCLWCGIEMESIEYKYLDLSGNGRSSNGGNFNKFNNERQQETTDAYVLNTSTKVFHRPYCRDVPKISPDNYDTSSLSRDALISSGYKACGHCSP